MKNAVLGCAVGLCLTVAPLRIASQMPPARVGEWSPAAAAAYLDGRQAWWMSWPNADRDHDTSCVSCHTALPYALARGALRTALGEPGPTPSEAELWRDVGKRVTLWNEVDPYYPDQRLGLPKTSESRGTEAVLNVLVLASRDAQQGELTSDTRRAFDNLWKLQFTRGEGAGAWAWLHFGLAPWESDGAAYYGAALAAVAVGIAPDHYAASTEVQESLALLRAYLQEGAESRSPYDRVMLLWAAAELSDLLTVEQSESIVDAVVRLQNADGGWSLASLGSWERQDGLPAETISDGYATGLIAFVLQRAGVTPARDDLSRALGWLVQNQQSGGEWLASSLNKERDSTSGRGRFMSDAATAFAVLALTQAEVSRFPRSPDE